MTRYLKAGGRKDNNHNELVSIYKMYCIETKDVTTVSGFCDLIVGTRYINDLVEIKSQYDKELTDKEAEFHKFWPGKVWIISSIKEAGEHIKDIWRRHAIIEKKLG